MANEVDQKVNIRNTGKSFYTVGTLTCVSVLLWKIP